MNRSRIPSPARSQGVSTPRKHTPRRSRSVCSTKSNVSARLYNVIADSFHLSPMPNRRSVLNDDTDIEVPGRKSWWKKLGENSRDVMEVLNTKDIAGVNNVAEEFDVEILSQEKKNYSLDLPESSDGESINSIVIPQRKLFTQKENQPQKKYKHIIDNRETLAKLQKSHFEQEKDINVGPKNLFNKASKPRNKPAFPAALLNLSSKAVNKTKEMPAPEVKGQVRNLFGNRPGTKRKNMFADFIVSESEDEIPDIQPKVFGFQKNAQKRRESSASRGVGHSPTSSIDLELDDWKHLPSSTMVENILDEETTPVKRAKLSKLSEAKESETFATNNTVNKTRQSNKSASSNNKSKASTSKLKDIKVDEVLSGSNIKEDLLNSKTNQSVNTSSNFRMTRNKSKSIRESSLKEEEHTRPHNKSQNKSQSPLGTPMEVDEDNENMKKGLNQQDVGKQVENMSTANGSENDDEDFTLEYENDDEPLAANDIENKSDDNIDLVDAVAATNEESIDKSKKNKSNIQSNKEELDDANTEKQNKSAVHEKEVNQSQKKVKQNQSLSSSKNILRTSQNASVGDVHQKSQKEALIEKDQMDNDEENVTNDIENRGVKQNVNYSTRRNEVQNENDDKPDEDVEQQNESSQSNNEKEIINERRKSKAEIKRQNESSQSNNDIQNESVLSDVESELDQEDNNENFDETVIEAEEEETENEQDESENEQESEEQVQEDASENEHEIEEHVQEDESENEKETEEQEPEKESENEQENEEHVQEDDSENEQETEKQASEEESENEQKTVDQAQEDESENEQENEEHIQEEESENEQETEEQAQEDESENEQETVEQAQEDESENEQESEEHVQEEESENEQESDTQIQQDESQNINSENQNDSESNGDETEEQKDEEMEVDEEENKSEHEVSDDNLQNESNLSKNSEEEDQVESDREQGEDDPENEIIETSNHDTTVRNKIKNITNVKSPEVILHDKTNQMESFTAEGRNTSIRKTKSVIKNLTIKPSLAPVRESVGFSDGTRDSSAEGSGWDSHRTTRKTIRLTLGKDFTPRKSLRTLVMEKSAKRQTNINEVTTKIPQANSTELPAFDSYVDPVEDNDTVEEPSDHEISARTRQTTLETYLQKIKQENLEKKRKMEEDIRASLKAPTRDIFNPFKVPLKPVRRMKPVQNKPKPKQVKSTIISLDMLPSEVLEDMKYKPPKRFQPSNASWITKRLYKFLENKLEPKYDYKARIRAERLVELLYGLTREVKRGPSDQAVDTLKKEMARLEIVKTHFDFYEFFHEFMPREVRVKVVPDIVNKISLPRGGVFSDILQ